MYHLGYMGTKGLHSAIFLWARERVNLLCPFGDNDSVTKAGAKKPFRPAFLDVNQVSEESL